MNWDDDSDKEQLKQHKDGLPQKVISNTQKYHANSVVDVAFDRKDPNQNSYRQNQLLYDKTQCLTKFGWKIAHLETQEEDLTLQCCSLLQSQFLYPVKFFVNLVQPTQNCDEKQPQIKCLWMEASIHRSIDTNMSNMFIPNDRSSQYTKIFEVYENKLLPKIVSFIKKYIDWGETIKHSKNKQEILNIFHDQVIRQMNDLIETQNKNSYK